MLDRALIAYGSPTLARLKLGSLFTVPAQAELPAELARLNGELCGKGVRLTALRLRESRALIYLYREDQLRQALGDPAIRRFLGGCGYRAFGPEAVLDRLRARLEATDGFPHEIGIFLGYPLADVIGFIENDGRNCLCCGCWKVYADEGAALRAFARFRKCKAVYERLFASGASLARLTVAARPA